MAIEKEIKIKVDKSEAEQNVKSLNKEFANTDSNVKGLTSKLDSLTGGLISKLGTVKKGLLSVGVGFKSIGAAISVSGIGLLLITIAGIVKAFKATEEGQNKFAKLMGVINSVIGNLVDLLSDFGEKIISVFENPKKSIQDLGKFLKNQLINRFTGLLNLIPELGRAFSKLAKLEFKEAGKIAADAVGKITLGIDSVTESTQKAINKTKEFVNELKQEAEIARQIANLRADSDKIERSLIVERAEADRKIARLRDIAARSDIYNINERKKALIEASRINEEITNKEIEAAKLRRDAIIQENTLTKSNKEDLKAEEEAKAEVIRLETKRLNLQKRLGTEIASINNQQKAAYEAEINRKAKQLEEEEKERLKKIEEEAKTEAERQENIDKIREEYSRKREDLEDVTELQRIERRKERALLELEELNANEQQKAEVISYYNEIKQKEEDRILKERLEKEDKKKKEEVELNRAAENAKLSIAGNTLDLIGGLLKEGSDLAKGVAVAQATISGIEGVQNAFTSGAKNPITTIFPAFPFVQAGLAGAFNALQIDKILNTDSSGASGRGASQSAAPSLSAPSFNLVAGTPENQISESIQQQNQRPIQAFVVSRSVTSAQEMDRNIESAATI